MPVPSRLAGRTAALAAALTLAAPAARAQNAAAVVQAPNSIEIGADAGAIFGLGDQSFIDFRLPAQKARLGFFLNNDSRVSIEPAVGLQVFKAENDDAQTAYTAELGALYHFRPARLITDVANRAAVSYVRPFVGISGTPDSDGGEGDDDVNDPYVGAGIGIKFPYRTNIAIRAEANIGYGFDTEAARLGLNLGLSFFTRRDR
jgi:opacity protein-like surface antigen